MQLLKEYDNVKMLSTDLDFSLNSWFVECKICSFLIGTKNFLRIRCISRIKSGLEYLHYVQKGWSNIFIARRSRNKITQFITIQIFIKGVHKTGSEYTGYLVYQFINFQLHIFLSRRHFPWANGCFLQTNASGNRAYFGSSPMSVHQPYHLLH